MSNPTINHTCEFQTLLNQQREKHAVRQKLHKEPAREHKFADSIKKHTNESDTNKVFTGIQNSTRYFDGNED